MKTTILKKLSKFYLLPLFLGLVFIACTQEDNGGDKNEPQGSDNNEVLDTDAKGNCKTAKIIVTNGDIKETYQVTYDSAGKIAQAVKSNGKYTFEHNSNGYFFSAYNTSGVLTNTKDVILNNDGKPTAYTEIIYDDKGKPYREQHNEFTYTDGKLTAVKTTEDGYQIRLYKFSWKNGNISEVEENGITERYYEYYTEHKYPKDGLICVDLGGFLETGIMFLGNNNTNLMKYSKVDTITSDISYKFNDHGKVVEQKIVRNDLSDPIYLTPTYDCM